MVYLYKCYFQNYVKESFHRPSETSYYKKLEILYKSVLDLYHRQITFDAENRRHLYRMLGILQENLRYPIQYHIHQNLELHPLYVSHSDRNNEDTSSHTKLFVSDR